MGGKGLCRWVLGHFKCPIAQLLVYNMGMQFQHPPPRLSQGLPHHGLGPHKGGMTGRLGSGATGEKEPARCHLLACMPRASCFPHLPAWWDIAQGVPKATVGGDVRVCALPSLPCLPRGPGSEKHLGAPCSGECWVAAGRTLRPGGLTPPQNVALAVSLSSCDNRGWS